MSRSGIDANTANALISSNLILVWFVRLDIQNQPVYVHSGYGNILINGTGDTAMDGITFNGIGNIGSIGQIVDGASGSEAVTLTLPGIQLTNDVLAQFVFNQDIWQGYNGYIWVASGLAGSNSINKPIRVKKGRMDQIAINIDPDSNKGEVVVTLESFASYSGQALFTRYSEQREIDPNDNSQDYVQDLANKTPEIGNTSSNATAGGASSTVTISQSVKSLSTTKSVSLL